jgi:hypothetical protein
MKLEHSTKVACRGVDHVDFSADGTYFIASCEFSAELSESGYCQPAVVGTIKLDHGRDASGRQAVTRTAPRFSISPTCTRMVCISSMERASR